MNALWKLNALATLLVFCGLATVQTGRSDDMPQWQLEVNASPAMGGTVTGAGTSYSDTNLSPNTAYSYTVAAYDEKGNVSGQSSAANATTLELTLAPTISSFTAAPSIITAGQSSTLSWSVSGTPAPTLSVKGVGTVSGTSVAVVPVASMIYTLTASNSNGTATAHVSIMVNPSPDTHAPSIPTNLSAVVVSSGRINIAWTASTDNVGVTGYRIYRGGTQLNTTSDTSYSDTGLSPGISYSYTVAAYDAEGNVSGQSSPVSTTTSLQINLGVMGASSSDEYRANDNRGGDYAATTLNWVELLEKYRGINVGTWGTWPSPRRTGYEYNWALSGAVASDVVARGQAAGLAHQVADGLVNTAVLYVGGNDFSPSINNHIYNGSLSGQALQDKINGVISAITTAVDTVKSAGNVNMIVVNIADPNTSVDFISGHPDATKRQLVIDAVLAVNNGIQAMANARTNVVVFDLFNLLNILPYPILVPNLIVGGEPISVIGEGDEPHNATLDGTHAGTVLSGIFANFMFVNTVDNSFGGTITPFSDQEILTNAGIMHTGDTTTPSTPTGLTATAVSSSRINLSWTASTDNVGYRIYRDGTQISATPGGYDNGATPQITATPNASYRFAGWLGQGAENPAAATTTVAMTQDRSLTAQFVKVWQLDVIASPGGGGSVSGTGTYDDGASPQITATPNAGYHFVTWLGQGVADPAATTTAVLMSQDRNLTGQFEPNPELRITATIDAQHGLKLSMPTVSRHSYQVEHAPKLDGDWIPLGDPLLGSGQLEEFDTAILPGVTQDFFRVVVTQP